MSTAVMTARSLELSSFAEKSLKVSAKFWFAVTMIGQLVFAFVMASFYGLTAVRGDYHKWTFTHGFIPGYSMGNAAVVTHLVTAVTHHVFRWSSAGTAIAIALPRISPLERTALYVGGPRPQRGWRLHDLDPWERGWTHDPHGLDGGCGPSSGYALRWHCAMPWPAISAPIAVGRCAFSWW